MACTAAAGGGMGAALVRSQQNIEIVLQAGVHAIEAQLAGVLNEIETAAAGVSVPRQTVLCCWFELCLLHFLGPLCISMCPCLCLCICLHLCVHVPMCLAASAFVCLTVCRRLWLSVSVVRATAAACCLNRIRRWELCLGLRKRSRLPAQCSAKPFFAPLEPKCRQQRLRRKTVSWQVPWMMTTPTKSGAGAGQRLLQGIYIYVYIYAGFVGFPI